jgi:SM-20-related protein
MAAEVERLAGAGVLAPARVGRGDRHLDPSIRGDEIAWLSASGEVESSAGTRAPSALAPLWAAFDAMRRALAESAYLRLDRFDVQLARYPGGGVGYLRHRDSFARGPGQRRLTAILYLNPAWAPADGGVLRLHLVPPRDLEPRLDRLVVFLSDRVEHEVLPALSPRLAATAWYYGPR